MEASGSSAERARARAAKKQFADLSATLGKSSDASAVSRALERVRGAVSEMNDPSGAEIAEAPRAKYAASLEREEEDEVRSWRRRRRRRRPTSSAAATRASARW